MNNRERTMAILNYENYDRLPIVHFGYWYETLVKWQQEGHIAWQDVKSWSDGNNTDNLISTKLGFDYNWNNYYKCKADIYPEFERKLLEVRDDGIKVVQNTDGVIILEKDDVVSIPAEIGHTLVDRVSWEKHYLPRLKFTADRIDYSMLSGLKETTNRENPIGLYCGSLYGRMRDWLGIEGVSYLYADDEELYDEIIKVVGELEFQLVNEILLTGASFDFGHFWEDICFKNGPLVNPRIFAKKVGPYYKKITDLLNMYGINIISLDCDGMIDELLPIWLENGINVMFPIEVGTWGASIKTWREKYGKGILGVGGMKKSIFAEDYNAVDKEIERLKSLVELGGYIPCPDHRIPPDAKWENVQYYCDEMRRVF